MGNEEIRQQLVDSVRNRESSHRQEVADPEWADRVEEAIELGEEKIRGTAYLFKDYLPDFDHYLGAKLAAYDAEIQRINDSLDPHLPDADMDQVIEDILDDFEDFPEVDKVEGGFYLLAEREPETLLANAATILGRKDAKQLITVAARKDPDSAFAYIDLYASAPWALDLVRELAIEDPMAFVRAYPRLKGEKQEEDYEFIFDDLLFEKGEKLLTAPYAKDFFVAFAEHAGFALFMSSILQDLADQPYAMDVFMRLVEKHPYVMMDEMVYPLIKGKYYFPYVLTKAIEGGAYLKEEVVLGLCGGAQAEPLEAYVKRFPSQVSVLLGHEWEAFRKESESYYGRNLCILARANIVSFSSKYEEHREDSAYRQAVLDAFKYGYGEDYVEALRYFEKEDFFDELVDRLDPIYTIPYILGYKTINGVREDPALAKILDIERDWLPECKGVDFPNFAGYVCRNLFFKKLPVDKAHVLSEYKAIVAVREQMKDTPLFAGRNVLLASHSQEWGADHDYKDRFGLPALVDGIKAQQGPGKTFKHVEAEEDTLEALKVAKKNILDAVVSMPSPFTFVFDGHGSPDAIYLSDGDLQADPAVSRQTFAETEKTVKITVDEMAEALTARNQRYGASAVQKDIFIYCSCYNHNFLRSVEEKLGSEVRMPISIGEAEYGASTYSDADSRYGSDFFEKVLAVGGNRTTFADLWGKSRGSGSHYASSNFSVYISDSEGNAMQLAKNEVDRAASSTV